ncbi:O-antigen ligase family protein [Alkaliphilus peptidifermentans]|uniref:O-antigen ligase n=1 Tax=Alkaliphilus peptidifermentans DSM 18978 TaxID=1120976 RepID=A0A1G5GEP0_9FIRM|nr:O-antigen ligase family protein [Alkaliphilus peptidifermentans]SCY49168.1 O-antigen ligase [Alkaliphilus peptidifermentans DSM 18978]
MENSIIIKSFAVLYMFFTESMAYKFMEKLRNFCGVAIKNSMFYRSIIKDYRFFQAWRASFVGTIFYRTCLYIWKIAKSIVKTIKRTAPISWSYKIFCIPYEILNKTVVRSYSILTLSVMLLILSNNSLLQLLGLAYVVYYSFFKIERGIYTVAFIIPFTNSTNLTLLALGLLVSFVFNNIKVKSLKVEPFFLLFFAFLLLSVVTSPFRGSSLRTLTLYGSGIIFGYILIFALDNRQKLMNFLKANVFAAVFQSVYAILQYRFNISMGGTWVDLEQFGEITTRAMGTLGNPNVLAKYLVITIMMGIIIMLTEYKVNNRILYGLCNLLIATGLILSLSRGGWLAFIFAVVVMALLIDKRLIFLMAVLGIGVLFLSPDLLLRRLGSVTNLQDTSNAYRISIWIGTIDLIRYNWLRGTGLGLPAFSYMYQYFVYGSALAVHSHNLILQIAAELGILGLGSFMLMLAALIKWSILSATKMKENKNKFIVYGLLAAIAGHMLHGFVDYVWYDPRILFAFWMLLGATICSVTIGQEESRG